MKLDIKTIGYVNAFETLTKTTVKDCFLDKNDNLTFIVGFGDAGKAIGRAGSNIKRLSNMIKKKIRVLEFNEDPTKFVANAIYPLKVQGIMVSDKIIIIKAESMQDRAKLIGRDRKNLNALQELITKFFDYEVKVE